MSTSRFLAATVALALASACTTDESTAFLSVGNETSFALVVYAFPDGTLIDPVPYLPPGSYDENLILSGRRLEFDSVPGYQPGKGVFLIVYIVQRQGAEFATSRTVNHAELQALRGHVDITISNPAE